jgi:hypothetical protein
MASTTPEKKVYKAQCHCADVKFTVALPPLESGATKIIRCSCSICTKNGYLLVYPYRTDVVFTKGEEKLSEYFFAKKTKPHRFCPNCGTSILIDFKNEDSPIKEKYGVSVSYLSSPFSLMQMLAIRIADYLRRFALSMGLRTCWIRCRIPILMGRARLSPNTSLSPKR